MTEPHRVVVLLLLTLPVVGCDFNISGTISAATEGESLGATSNTESDEGTGSSSSGESDPGLDDETGLDETSDASETGTTPGADDPGPHLTVFISSLQYTGALGGLAGADARCQVEAEAALLPGTYRAWLSDSAVDAIDRITGEGPWLDVHDNIIFNNAVGLQLAPLSPIVVQPNGIELDWASDVWTGTYLGGTGLGPFCGDWNTTDGQGTVGEPEGGDQGWTAYAPRYCQETRHVYCFEVAQ